ncbi:hypothetical protein [Streptomyces spongiae]|uniref:Uncharacterized protein n=1 Tax=Streptomyces spongiae TaxID=565072 RepID=A0A5N8XV16_9ACTN|nr:hypothetical protein [Streptomyces spongiae]MPY63223.1 hypothetical protein [Streptomyces spongiae]
MNSSDWQPWGGGEVEMGGQQGDSTPSGRHFARPGADDPQDFRAESSPVAVLLAAAVRARDVEGKREARAVAAFLEAREQGAHPARTRRRDDWRPRGVRRARRSLRATLAALLAGLTLGGVAVAAIGVSSGGDGEGQGRAGPSSSAPERPGSTPPDSTGSSAPAPGASPSGPSDRPSQAQDTEAHCRAFEKVEGRGKAMDATAWQRLIDAAGGESRVRAYCAERLGVSGGGSERQKKDKERDTAGASSDPSTAARTTPRPGQPRKK